MPYDFAAEEEEDVLKREEKRQNEPITALERAEHKNSTFRTITLWKLSDLGDLTLDAYQTQNM